MTFSDLQEDLTILCGGDALVISVHLDFLVFAWCPVANGVFSLFVLLLTFMKRRETPALVGVFILIISLMVSVGTLASAALRVSNQLTLAGDSCGGGLAFRGGFVLVILYSVHLLMVAGHLYIYMIVLSEYRTGYSFNSWTSGTCSPCHSTTVASYLSRQLPFYDVPEANFRACLKLGALSPQPEVIAASLGPTDGGSLLPCVADIEM